MFSIHELLEKQLENPDNTMEIIEKRLSCLATNKKTGKKAKQKKTKLNKFLQKNRPF